MRPISNFKGKNVSKLHHPVSVKITILWIVKMEIFKFKQFAFVSMLLYNLQNNRVTVR